MSPATDTLLSVLGRARPAREIAAQGVAARDFARPMRFGRERTAALRLALKRLLPALEKRMDEMVGLRVVFELGELAEVDAETLFARPNDTPCVLRFRCQKAPAWLVWDPAAAVSVVQAIFGATGAAEAARKLSPTEVRVATQFLSEIVRAVAGALLLATSDFAFVQASPELGTWRESGHEASAHRLEVQLVMTCGSEASVLHLYFPGVEPDVAETLAALPGALPAHLERVEVELSACLEGCEISLDQLLALEEGDVIPLAARLGDPTRLCVEGLTLAQARLGSHRGRLAVRVERVSVQPESTA
ncbi:MAG: hypothetical protein EXS08_11330 [Planctomycetes bacterium]|nr:hypothetical protein [Planctomycetota bacterium]